MFEKVFAEMNGGHMAGPHREGPHMMDWGWWEIPTFMGTWMLGFWLLFLVIGIFVYRDAEKRDMNGFLWFILVIIPWIGILALIVYLVVRETSIKPTETPIAILDERYAKGEITRDEYLTMKDDLEKK